jgi:hypothetical protein
MANSTVADKQMSGMKILNIGVFWRADATL